MFVKAMLMACVGLASVAAYAEAPVDSSLAPTEQDVQKARRDRAKGIVPKVQKNETQIEAVRDQNNRVTEYVVTPKQTQIPYTIQNQADRPIDSSPAGNSKSTLGVTKFFEIELPR